MTWQWPLSAKIDVKRFTRKASEAVEIVENFHGLLHGFTFVAFGADVK